MRRTLGQSCFQPSTHDELASISQSDASDPSSDVKCASGTVSFEAATSRKRAASNGNTKKYEHAGKTRRGNDNNIWKVRCVSSGSSVRYDSPKEACLVRASMA
mmetsp:Transcript_55366/g.161614  ORF Transcript_55366/g.161614 Transcript_55366/m.161614 type:complete len:103 (+) Transcript_55366:790-1098(+)